MNNKNLGWMVAGVLILIILSWTLYQIGISRGQEQLKHLLNDGSEFPLRYKNIETNKTFFRNIDLDKYCVALIQQAQAQQGR